jgi:hypothetical protein
MNGLLLEVGYDYLETSSSSVTLTTAATLGDEIECLGIVNLVDILQPTINNAEVDIAVATTTDIGGASTNFIRVVGAGTINSLGTNFNGPIFLRFTDVVILTNGSALICPASTNLVVGAGYTCVATPKATAGAEDGWVISSLSANSFVQPYTGAVTRTNQLKLQESVSVKDFGAKGDGTTDDTIAITLALAASNYVIFPPGSYSVSSITFSIGGQRVDFNNAMLVGNATVATVAVVRFTATQGIYNNLRVTSNYNLNYTAAVQIYSSTLTSYCGRSTWTNLGVYNSIIGVLIGTLVSSTPINNPVSENTIIGGEFRDVQICFYNYQPNGFIHIIGMTVDCQKYEWDLHHAGVFSYLNSVGIQNCLGNVHFHDCEFVKAQTSLGYAVVNGLAATRGTWTTTTAYAVNDIVKGPTGYQDKNYYCYTAHTSGTFATDLAAGKFGQLTPTMMITGCNVEAACTNFFGFNGGRYIIDGWNNNYWNDATTAFIEIENTSYGVFKANSMNFYKSAYAPDIGLINTHTAIGWIFRFTNCTFENQNIPSMFHGDTGYSTQCNVRFSGCTTIDANYGYIPLDSSPVSLQPNLLLLPAAGIGAVPPAATYQVSVAGTSILVQTDVATSPTLPDTPIPFVQCIDMISGAGQNNLYLYPAAGPTGPAMQGHMIFEWWQKTIAATGNFNGSITALYLDSSGAGFLGAVTLCDCTIVGGYAGNIPYNNTAALGWTRNEIIIPFALNNANLVGIRFTQNAAAQRWKLGGFKFY